MTTTPVPHNRYSRMSAVPIVGAVTIVTAQTAANGTDWVAFGDQACNALDIDNNTGTTIQYRRNGAGNAMEIATGAARLVVGIENADEIEIKRTDESTTQVTVRAEALS